jgi:hypothetical protein
MVRVINADSKISIPNPSLALLTCDTQQIQVDSYTIHVRPSYRVGWRLHTSAPAIRKSVRAAQRPDARSAMRVGLVCSYSLAIPSMKHRMVPQQHLYSNNLYISLATLQDVVECRPPKSVLRFLPFSNKSCTTSGCPRDDARWSGIFENTHRV